MQLPIAPTALLISFVLTSCANVKFYSDEALTQKTGIRYYQPKPYVMVTKTGNKENPVKIEVIYLPDISAPNFAVYKPGWGKHQFSLTLANGIMTQYGQETDSQVPETINAIAGLAAQGATAFKTFKEAQRLESAEIDAAKGSVQQAIGYLATLEQQPAIVNYGGLKQAATDLKRKLSEVEQKLDMDASAQLSVLSSILAQVKTSRIQESPGVADAVSLNNTLDLAANSIQTAIRFLEKLKATPPQPDFILFEIVIRNGETSLIPASNSVRAVLMQAK